MGLSPSPPRLAFWQGACLSRGPFDCRRSVPYFDLIKTLEGQQTPVDRTLALLDTKPRVALIPPFLVLMIFVIAQADSILTVPHMSPLRLRRTRRGTASRDQCLSHFMV
jgi:hypothetical protein